MPDATEPVLRQGMEHRRAFPLKAAPGSSNPKPFEHASEDAKCESGKREEGQRCHGADRREPNTPWLQGGRPSYAAPPDRSSLRAGSAADPPSFRVKAVTLIR